MAKVARKSSQNRNTNKDTIRARGRAADGRRVGDRRGLPPAGDDFDRALLPHRGARQSFA